MANLSSYEFGLKVFGYLKWTGYGAFTIEHGRLVTKATDWFWFLLNLLIAIVMFAASITFMNAQSSTKSTIIFIGNLLTLNGSILLSIYSLINNFRLRNKIYLSIVNLYEVDLLVS